MKRAALIFTIVLIIGAALELISPQFLNAQQAPVKVTELFKSDLAESGGKEGRIILVEIAPGAAVGRHYHPGDAFAYTLEGSMVLVVDGKPPVTMKAGESGYVLPKQVHDDKNASQTAPVKFLVFFVVEKGQPFAVPVQ